MKKINTLMAIAIALFSLSLNAQDTVSYYGWEEGTTFGPVGSIWNNEGVTWVHETVIGDAENAHSGEGYFKATVSENPPNQWDNQGVFQEIAIEENTSYRLGFWMRAEGDAPMINITSGTYNNWQEIQRKSSVAIGEDWKYYSLMVYVTTSEEMLLTDADGRYTDTIRLPIHYYGTGDYFVDDVIVAKSTIAGVSYNNNVVAVDFGYNVDYTPGVLPDAFTVTVDGAEVAATSAVMVIVGTSFEPKVYLTMESSIAEGSVVVVDYNGNEDLYYSSYSPPTDATYRALGFNGEGAFFDASLEIPEGTAVKSKDAVQFSLFPNPVINKLSIESSVSVKSIEIFDLAGKLVLNSPIDAKTNSSLDVSVLKSGVYMLTVKDVKGNISSKKFIK